jgi:CHAT domain-containing protein/exonuclease VII small subunit
LYENGYRLSKEVLGDKHPNTLSSLNNLAFIYQAIGRLDDALPLYENGYRLSKEVLGDKHPDTLSSLNHLASIYRAIGRLDDALPLYENGYRLSKEVLGDKHSDTLISLKNLAFAYAAQGAIDKAIRFLDKLVKDVEILRSGDLSAENRQALFKQYIGNYFALSHLYLLSNNGADAFHTAEMTKARTLLESMTLKLAAQQGGLSGKEQQKLQNHHHQLTAFNNLIANAENFEKRLEFERQKNQVVKQAAEFQRVLMNKYPKFKQLADPDIITATDGAKLIPSDTLFISYLLRQDNHLLVFTLDATGDLQAHDLGKIAGLEQTLETYRELLAAKYSVMQLRSICYFADIECQTVWQIADGSFVIGDKPSSDKKPIKVNSLDEISRDLAQKLLAPLKERLPNYRRWIISPDGALALIPFETLILDRQPVIAKHEISYVQSLSVLALLKQREQDYQSLKARKTLLAMGAPRYHSSEQPPKDCKRAIRAPNIDLETFKDYQRALKDLNDKWCNLPGAKKELAAMKQQFPDATLYQEAEASEAKLQSLNAAKALTDYEYLVFATHGYLSPQTPALSALVLDLLDTTDKADGYVTAAEWPGYDLKSDLMVLSACQTGVGKIMRGEGVMGLPYAFYVAGNKNTLMTLWNVADDSTAEFMSRFFKKLKNGKGHIDALTETKREFLQIEKYRLPVYWAAFVLYGV